MCLYYLSCCFKHRNHSLFLIYYISCSHSQITIKHWATKLKTFFWEIRPYPFFSLFTRRARQSLLQVFGLPGVVKQLLLSLQDQCSKIETWFLKQQKLKVLLEDLLNGSSKFSVISFWLPAFLKIITLFQWRRSSLLCALLASWLDRLYCLTKNSSCLSMKSIINNYQDHCCSSCLKNVVHCTFLYIFF